MEELIFLKRKNIFLEEKIKNYENIKSPIINTLPLNVYDIDIIDKNETFLTIVLITNKNDRRCPVIKILIENIKKQINDNKEYLEITEYININKYAEKTIKNGKWCWEILLK